ncbi:unnamed protein product [Adineta steineri]|uniref:RBR-type E3 ubiquitin transferase n=1 Tax=Adineta steineri TaxID=433720 RepID=A0A813NZC6_9BILA|nr:unnamed protein product [Adineta steineri]CAF1570479.1 unnamed protein product [Adineta steineri]
MVISENRSEENRHFQTWPFHRQYSNGNNIHNNIYHNSEQNLSHDKSLKSIFMTDASKTFENHIIISMDRGTIVNTSSHENSQNHEDLSECPICCSSIQLNELKQMSCCSIKLCSPCFVTHTITNIQNGKVKIECPACSQEINSLTILYNIDIPMPLRERYQELLAQDLSEKQNTCIKLCPHCNFITILDEHHPIRDRKKFRRSSQQWVHCEQCDKEWCWSCYAPSHPEETCRQFKKNHTQLDMWANSRRLDNQQRNAQRCPKCSIYIEKIDGCDHMICSKCSSKFCYRCGSKMRLPNYIGHDAKYSIFGCKYKLLPNHSLLRWFVRGSIFTGIVLLTPIVLAIAIAIVAIGIPILLVVGCCGLPIYAYTQYKKRS